MGYPNITAQELKRRMEERKQPLFKELPEDAQEELASQIRIAELQEYYQTLAAETDGRALDPGPPPDLQRAPSTGENDNDSLTRNYNSRVYAARDTWEWLIQVSRCTEIHLRNAADYHQFFLEVRHYDHAMQELVSQLCCHGDKQKPQSQKDAQSFIKQIKEVLQTLLDYQSKIDVLFAKSGGIIPLPLRKDPLPHPVQCQALTAYRQRDLTVVEGEEYTLLDNSEVTKWKVADAGGREGLVPAIVFLIPPPYREAVQNASRLRRQLEVTWRDCMTLLRRRVRSYFREYLATGDSSKLKCLNPSTRADIAKCLADLPGVLCALPREKDVEEVKEVLEAVDQWGTAISNMQGTGPDRRGQASGLQLQWSGHRKLARLLQEFATYAGSYAAEVARTRQEEDLLVTDGSVSYVSKAYIERLRPVDLDDVIPLEVKREAEAAAVQHMTMAERVPEVPEGAGSHEEWWTEEGEVRTDRFSVETTAEQQEEEVISEQTIKETQTFSIVGVVDPRNDERISIYRAIAEGIISQTQGTYRNPSTGHTMPIPEAMNQGLILVEYSNKSVEMGDLIRKGIVRTTTKTDSVSYSVQKVVDPVTGRGISVAEAVRRGIIDQHTGQYVNPLTGSAMSITDAIEQGLLEVKVVDGEEEASPAGGAPGEDSPDRGDSGDLDADVVVRGVRNPRTGRFVTLPEAVRMGLVDPESGLYKNPITGEEMTLAEALQRGFLQVSLADPSQKAGDENILKARLLVLSGSGGLQDILTDTAPPTMLVPLSVSQSVYGKIQDRLSPDLCGIREQASGRELSVEDALEQGILCLSPLSIKNANGDKFTLHEAAALGLIDLNTVRALVTAMEPFSLHHRIQDGHIDPDSGRFVDPDTGAEMSLAEAVARGKLDPDTVFYTDLSAACVTSLGSAMEDKRWDGESGLVLDPQTGAEVTLAEAVEARLVDPHVDADGITDQVAALKFLKALVDTNAKGVKDTRTGQDLSLEEAVLAGVLRVSEGDYVDSATKRSMSLPEAVKADLVTAQAARRVMEAMAARSLGQMVAQGQIDPTSGKFIHPDTQRKMAIQDAIEQGLLDPASVFLLDPASGKVTSLAALIKEGRFNPISGKFKDPLTGLEVSIDQAIRKGIIQPNFDPAALIEEKVPLKDLMDTGKLHTHSARFVTPDGQEMSLKEAIAAGYVTPDSAVVVDASRGGALRLAGQTDLVQALVSTKRHLDWVEEIEEALVSKEKPSEELKELEQQLQQNQDLKKVVSDRSQSVDDLLKDAMTLLEDNKDAAKKDPACGQQYQRLRFNTSDLKVRFEALNTQLDSRLGALQSMLADVTSFHDNLDAFEGWVEESRDEMTAIQRAAADTDHLDEAQASFMDFNERALAHEDELQAVTNAGNKVIQDAKDYEKEAEAFRQKREAGSLRPDSGRPRPATPAPGEGDREPASPVERQLQAANDQFKGVLQDCTALMAKLTDTAAKNKRYNQLKGQLAKTLPEIEDKVNLCSAEVTPGQDPGGQQELLKGVTADVISQGKNVDDLQSVGRELVAILEELDCKDTPKAQEIENTIEEVQSRYDQIQETVVDKQHTLSAAITRSKDADHNLTSLLDWVAETEGVFAAMRPVSLDRDALNEQIQAHRVVTSDIDNQRPQVDSTVEQCQDKPGCQEKINELLDRFDGLIQMAQDRGSDLDDVVDKLGSLHGNVNQLESWLVNAVGSLKRESSSGFDPTSLKNKIENLYRQKQGKQGDLDRIKAIGRELIADPNTGDNNRLRETLADVQGKWHDLTELLVQMISFAALREIDDVLKYLDKAENDINTAEPVSTDPENLAVQLRDHKGFHEDLESKRRAVNDTIDKCNKMLRETVNEEAEDIQNKLDTIRSQADVVCKLSSERLSLLEEALPLASHFSETHADLQSWLGEIAAEVESLDVPRESNPEQVRKQQDNAKTTQRIIEDHKPLVEDLVVTGRELMDVCTDEDAADLKDDLDHVTAKYDDVKGAIRERLNQLDEAFRSVTTDVGDTLDGLLEELHYLSDQLEHADPVAANPDAVREQMNDNTAVMDDLERRMMAIQNTKEAVSGVLAQESQETKEECDDLRAKLQDLEGLEAGVRHQARERSAHLEETLGVAEKFQRDYQDAIRALRDIQDNLASQDHPGIDPVTIKEQQRELEAIQEELQKAQYPLEECRKTADHLTELCGVPGRMEIQKHMEDLDTDLEEIEDGARERREELESALDKAERYDQTLQAIMSWLPKSEDRLAKMIPVAADPRSVKIQIEELKVYKVGVHPRYVDIQNLNQFASELKSASPLTAESLGPQLKEVNTRWQGLLQGIQDRERTLKDSLVELGELDHALDDVIGFLTEAENELQGLEDIYGDPKFIETYLKKIKMIQKDMQNQDPCVKKLNVAVDRLVERSVAGGGGGGRASPLLEKQVEMNELMHSVGVLARDKQNELHETLKEVKGFMGNVDDVLRWLGDFRTQLKSTAPMGALPETAQRQFDKFMGGYQALGQKEEEVRALLLNGEDMLARCREEDARALRENLGRLQSRMFDTRSKAERRRRKLEEHLENVHDFHAMLKIHTEWLNNAEKILASFKHPSKLVDRILEQIRQHKDFKMDIDAHREIMLNLDRTGTYLKYFGRKQDTVYIKNLLISIKLRWKKLVRRADEKGRLLQQAHKEDKRFYDSWKGLCDWLNDSEKKYKKFSGGAKVKQDMDELRHFQHEQSARHPSYYSTMRLGRGLKERCVKADPERDVLHGMLEDLKNRWNIVRSIVSQRQNKLDEALLSSGRVSDALQSLLEWLSKAETYLAEEQPILGDLDTVSLLIEQHKAFEQELESRQGVVAAMRASPCADRALQQQLDELSGVWERVNQLCEVRETKLQEALKLAEDFNEAVQVVREWLPQAEAELKFRALPDDEDAIVQLIENHEKFQEELRDQQPNVEKIRFMAEEVLNACHPNAIRFVKYYLTITQTRWEQAVNRAGQRSQRLQDALRNTRGNAAMVEELLAWLTEAQALLAAKEKDPIPEDLTVVEALVKEHLEFHDDLSQKNKDAERLTKLPTSNAKKQLHGSAWKLTELDSPSPRQTTLQNKWRNVWRVSVDRKKKLQDALDHLLELESFKNFDFDLWRHRYVSWIRAKKFRITDFFRRQDKDQDGALTRKEFVEGMLVSKFPSNRTELNAVFDIFDTRGNGLLDNAQFVEALKPERQRPIKVRTGKRAPTEAELINDEIEQQVSHCQCRNQFPLQRMAEAKYKFGEKGKMCMVRFLNSTVMVRVGGGWVTLDEFLNNNDPCRASNHSTPFSGRRGTVAVASPGDVSGTSTPKSRKSTPISRSNGTSGRSTPTGTRTPTGSRTPSSARSRSPGPPRSSSSTPSTPNTPSTPSGRRTPTGQRSSSPASASRAAASQKRLASASKTMKF